MFSFQSSQQGNSSWFFKTDRITRYIYTRCILNTTITLSRSLSIINCIRQLSATSHISSTHSIYGFFESDTCRWPTSLCTLRSRWQIFYLATRKLIELVIQHFHQGFLHAGPRLVLGMIRRKFWILSGRDAVCQYIFRCITCVRHKAIRPNPIMGHLSSFRVQPHRPFNQVGLDYRGPFSIKESRRRNVKTSNSYLALFMCMTIKDVHLELVTDISMAVFLAALDRFVAHRGIPPDLFSDCGINYVGAARQLKELF